MPDLANAPETDDSAPEKDDAEIVSVARKRLTTAMAAWSPTRDNELEDLKFAAGSPDNDFQWPGEALATRQNENGVNVRPCLTINKLPSHIKQVTNDMRQNRPAGKVIPANDEAHEDVADVFNDLVRYIEYISDADVADDTAGENQVTFGEGYFRLLTKYVAEDSFDQDIYIESIRNSFSIYLDPMIKKPCGEDAEWAFVIENLTHDEYHRQFPDAKMVSSIQASGVGDSGVESWIDEKTIRIAEYFCFETTTTTLNQYADGSKAFEGTPEDKALRKQGKPVKSRPSDRRKVMWYKTNGYEILDKREWPGKYIPIVRVLGNEFEIEGQIYISGIVRNAKDAQRMYNYHASNEVEMIALAPKAPFIGYGGQFEGYENKWKTANVIAHPYLEVNGEAQDGEGRPLPLPQRAQPPMVQSGIIAAKEAASEDIKTTTGQYNASLGQQSNERSGKAIIARQHEGDVSTYHYVGNLGRAVRHRTRMIVDLIPKIYDAKRTALIMGEDGTTRLVNFDPSQKDAVQHITHPNDPNIVIKKIYNPNVGRYDVRTVTGPGYATKRQEALDSMVQLLQTTPQLWSVMGDLIVKNMDWPGAQELVERLRRSIDPKLLQGDDTDPALQQAQQQIKQLMDELNHAHAMLTGIQNSVEMKEIQIKQQEVEIKAYDAQTKRIEAAARAAQAATQDKAIQTPEQIQDVVLGTIHAAQASGDIPGQAPGMDQGQQAPQEPQQPAPPLDQNKVLVEASKHALQDKQHAHEMTMAQMQAAQQAQQAEQAAQQPTGGPDVQQ